MTNLIYDLKLHETTVVDTITNDAGIQTTSVMKVPGGWIYRTSVLINGSLGESTTFVPYDKEFKTAPSASGWTK